MVIVHAGLVGTVQGLRDGLRSQGSDLIVLRGPLEQQLPALAAAVGAQRIVTEDEVEYRHVRRSPEGSPRPAAVYTLLAAVDSVRSECPARVRNRDSARRNGWHACWLRGHDSSYAMPM